MTRCKLYCLPYAGGSSLVFSEWKKHISRFVDIIPIELKGRGQRNLESFYSDTREAAADILKMLKRDLNDNEPYCIFGQSLGGLIIFDMLQEMMDLEVMQMPFHVFFSAIFPPHINKIVSKLHTLSDEAFIKQLTTWSSLPIEITQDQAMLQMWIPVLKADYRLLENYHFSPKNIKFPFEISILKGELDHWLSKNEYLEWDRYSDRKIDFYEIRGGHLFIHERKMDVITIVNSTIDGYF